MTTSRGRALTDADLESLRSLAHDLSRLAAEGPPGDTLGNKLTTWAWQATWCIECLADQVARLERTP